MPTDHHANRLFYPKILTALKGYTAHQLGRDLLSGLIVAVIALPLSIAFGIASGVTPSQGLLTAVVAGFLISLLGGSRVQVGGPTGAFIVIIYGIVEKFGVPGLIISTLMAGLMLVGMGLLRFGSVIRFIPQPIIIGFTSGIAVTILVTQFKDFFGLQLDKVPGEFFAKMEAFAGAAGTLNGWALLVGALTLGLIIVFAKLSHRMPGPFFALVIVTALAQFFHWPVTTIGSLFGSVSLAPTPLSFDGITYQTIIQLLPAAFSIAFLGAIESLLSAVVADAMIGGRHRSNTELIGQGVANVASAFLGGIPATGAIARTAANVRNGGRTPIAGLAHAVFLLVIVLFLSQVAALIPMAALAGILVFVAFRMGEWREFAHTFRTTRADALVLVVTFAVTVFVDLVYAIGIGLVVSSFLFIQQIAKISRVEVANGQGQDEDPDTYYDRDRALSRYSLPPGVFALELNGSFFFGAATKFEESLRPVLKRARVLLVRMEGLDWMDATGLRVFRQLLKDAFELNIRVVVTEANPAVMDLLARSHVVQVLGQENIFATFEEALRDLARREKPAPDEETLDPAD